LREGQQDHLYVISTGRKNEDVEDCSDIGFAKDNYNKQLFKSNCSHSLNTPAGELEILKELFSYNQ